MIFPSYVVGLLPKYFSSEWSFAQFRLPQSTNLIVAFGSENDVIIVGMNGRYEYTIIVSLPVAYAPPPPFFSETESLIFNYHFKIKLR